MRCRTRSSRSSMKRCTSSAPIRSPVMLEKGLQHDQRRPVLAAQVSTWPSEPVHQYETLVPLGHDRQPCTGIAAKDVVLCTRVILELPEGVVRLRHRRGTVPAPSVPEQPRALTVRPRNAALDDYAPSTPPRLASSGRAGASPCLRARRSLQRPPLVDAGQERRITCRSGWGFCSWLRRASMSARAFSLSASAMVGDSRIAARMSLNTVDSSV